MLLLFVFNMLGGGYKGLLWHTNFKMSAFITLYNLNSLFTDAVDF